MCACLCVSVCVCVCLYGILAYSRKRVDLTDEGRTARFSSSLLEEVRSLPPQSVSLTLSLSMPLYYHPLVATAHGLLRLRRIDFSLGCMMNRLPWKHHQHRYTCWPRAERIFRRHPFKSMRKRHYCRPSIRIKK